MQRLGRAHQSTSGRVVYRAIRCKQLAARVHRSMSEPTRFFLRNALRWSTLVHTRCGGNVLGRSLFIGLIRGM